MERRGSRYCVFELCYTAVKVTDIEWELIHSSKRSNNVGGSPNESFSNLMDIKDNEVF